MSAPSDNYTYSTLEVATENDRIRHGLYPEVAPSSEPEAYGYYAPPKTEQQNAQFSDSTPRSHINSTAYTYSTYPEVAQGGGAAPGGAAAAVGATEPKKICGLRRRYFWFALAAAVLIVVAIIVGAVVGTMKSHSSGSAADKGASEGGNGNGGDNNNSNNNGGTNSTASGKLSLYGDTRLASANFTDAYGNDNYVLIYQLSDASVCMSTFNSSNNKWVASTIVNGTEGIKLGSSLAVNTIWQGSNSPEVDLYYQSNGSAATIEYLIYKSNDNLSTTSVTPPDKWVSVNSAKGFNTLPGSALVSYGKQCDFCNQYAYLFWQGDQGIFMTELSATGIGDVNLIDVSTVPSANTSMALTYSGTLTGDTNAILRRSIDIFYRSTTSGLTQLRVGNGLNVPMYVGRDIGPRTNFAAFSTGFNESAASENPNPLGFQVLSIDPDVDNGVQLTYLKDSKWTVGSDEVEALADCRAKATMAVNTGRRLYCLVDSGDNDTGVEIIEWAWQGDPSDTDTYLNWNKIGAVDVGV
ncbi:hypothetical protein F4777DRAFT_573446 [Nemania sp. FL0916]|nr:hypothetical protein F4777DRAFT_573446 [Nemania sp. FL0916]